jgi:subtilase family serine protease
LDGSGQAVGLFEMDGYYPGDIATYESLAGLPDIALTNVVVDGFSGPPGANNVEVALDIDMAMAMAPGLSKVIVYEGSTGNDILNRMATDDSARQLSCSWSFGSAVDSAREQIFEQFAAQGQSLFQASGDDGGGQILPPSDDPFVTVVGGTSLTTGTNGTWQSETTWPDSAGGISANYTIPVWQQGVNMTANQGSTVMRNIPDVACLADSIIWLVANNGEQGVVGGTSAAAPLWAGFAALINQQAAANNQSSIGFANPAIYALGQSTNYAPAFHDIITGNNTNSSSPTKFFAVPGYDLCTGWGTRSDRRRRLCKSPPKPALLSSVLSAARLARRCRIFISSTRARPL